MAQRDGKYVAGALNLLGKRDDLWPQLGQLRRLQIPAFRVLLLPGDRIRHRPRAEAGRGRRAGPAQIAARLSAGADLQRPLDPRPRLSPRRRAIPRPRAPDGRAQDRGAGRILAVPARNDGIATPEERAERVIIGRQIRRAASRPERREFHGADAADLSGARRRRLSGQARGRAWRAALHLARVLCALPPPGRCAARGAASAAATPSR